MTTLLVSSAAGTGAAVMAPQQMRGSGTQGTWKEHRDACRGEPCLAAGAAWWPGGGQRGQAAPQLQ